MINDILIPVSNYINRQISKRTGIKTVLKNQFLGDRKFYCTSRIEAFRTLKYGNEASSLGAFLFLLKEDDIIWDIGASVGLFSIHAAQHVNKIIAFEPDPEIYNRFRENVQLNQLEEKISSQAIAIGEEDGTMELRSDGIEGMSPSLNNLNRHTKSVKVQVQTIDTLIEELPQKPTVIKMDIEGAEIYALRGGNRFLNSNEKPRLLFIEAHPEFLPAFNSSVEEIITILNNYSYRILSTQKRDNQIHLIAIRNEI